MECMDDYKENHRLLDLSMKLGILLKRKEIKARILGYIDVIIAHDEMITRNRTRDMTQGKHGGRFYLSERLLQCQLQIL
jgi:hypothetical protein